MATPEADSSPRCRCGHDRGHHMVTPEADYTFMGYVALFFGISAKPIRIRYHCRRCDQTLDETTDPRVLDGDS